MRVLANFQKEAKLTPDEASSLVYEMPSSAVALYYQHHTTVLFAADSSPGQGFTLFFLEATRHRAIGGHQGSHEEPGSYQRHPRQRDPHQYQRDRHIAAAG